MSVWPDGPPATGQRAQRTRVVNARDIELFTEITGDRNPLHYDAGAAAASPFGEIIVQGGITGGVEVLEAREDKPITTLRTTVVRQDGTVVLEGTAVCYTAAVVR